MHYNLNPIYSLKPQLLNVKEIFFFLKVVPLTSFIFLIFNLMPLSFSAQCSSCTALSTQGDWGGWLRSIGRLSGCQSRVLYKDNYKSMYCFSPRLCKGSYFISNFAKWWLEINEIYSALVIWVSVYNRLVCVCVFCFSSFLVPMYSLEYISVQYFGNIWQTMCVSGALLLSVPNKKQ